VSRLLTPEELKALLATGPYIPAPTERFHVVVDAGHADLAPEEVAALAPGSVIPLDRRVGHPVEIVANAVTVARGDLVEIDGRIAVRVRSMEHPHPTPGTRATPETSATPGKPAPSEGGKR
jgi:hypothetical protein